MAPEQYQPPVDLERGPSALPSDFAPEGERRPLVEAGGAAAPRDPPSLEAARLQKTQQEIDESERRRRSWLKGVGATAKAKEPFTLVVQPVISGEGAEISLEGATAEMSVGELMARIHAQRQDLTPDRQRLFIVDRGQEPLEDETLPIGVYEVFSGVRLHLAMRDEAQAAQRREQRAQLRREASAFAASCELHFDRQGNVEESAIAEIKALFKAMDRDGNSKISSDEFVRGVKALRVDCDPAETFKVLDVDDDGELDLDELCLAIGADLLAAKNKDITASTCLANVLESILPDGSQQDVSSGSQKEAPGPAAVEVQRQERRRGRCLGVVTAVVGLLTLAAGVVTEMNDGDFDPAVEPDEGYDIAQLAGLIIVALGLLGIVCPSAAEYITAMFPLYLACCSPWEVGRPDDRIVGLPKLLEYITRVKEADCAYRWHVQNCKRLSLSLSLDLSI